MDVSNGSEEDIADLQVVLTATTASKNQPVDWNKTDVGAADLSVNTITWDAVALSKKGKLAAGERETIDLNLPILATLGTASDVITFAVTANVGQVGGVDVTRSLQSTPLKVSINSDTTFTINARYFEDGTPVGTGPLPPQVGQTTRYRLSWNIKNTLHALDAVTVSATVPPGVNYVGSIANDIGTISFDPASRLLSWTIDRLPITVTSASTTFDLSVTPTASDVGTFVKLLNASALTATDSSTKSRIDRSSSAQTSEIPNDSEAATKGAVVE